MAKIKADRDKLKACKAVNEALKNIEMINTVLSENKDITIRVDVRQEFSLDSRAMQKFRTVITMQRQRMIADINALIKRYDLELDEDEERVIRDDAILSAGSIELRCLDGNEEIADETGCNGAQSVDRGFLCQ